MQRGALVGARGAEVELFIGVKGAAEVVGPDADGDCDAVGHLYGGEAVLGTSGRTGVDGAVGVGPEGDLEGDILPEI